MWGVLVVSFWLLHVALLQQLKGDYLRTPAGFRHKSCVIEVESGSTVLHETDDSVSIYPPKPTLSGSVHFSQKYTLSACPWNLPVPMKPPDSCSNMDHSNDTCQYVDYAFFNRWWDNFTAFNGSWNTPGIPQSKATDFWSYHWIGLWNTVTSALIQPALGWNSEPNTWDAASWYVVAHTGYVVHSSFMTTHPNNVGIGAIYKQSDGSYMVSYEDTTAKQSTYLIAKSVADFDTAQVVHEQWAHFDCDEQPTSSITFSQLNLFDTIGKVFPVWRTSGSAKMDKCGTCVQGKSHVGEITG